MYISELNNLINNINLSECKSKEDFIKKEIIFSVLGSDFFGQAIDSRVLIPNPLSNFSSPFDFSKNSKDIKPITGTIIGFSTNMNELFSITESNSKKLEEQDNNRGGFFTNMNNINNDIYETMSKTNIKAEINITPNNDPENKVGILLDNIYINKSELNVQELFPKIFNQCRTMPLINTVDYKNINIEQKVIDNLIDFLDEKLLINKNNNDIID